MSITVRVTKSMSQQINEMIEIEGFSNKADVVYTCTRFFIDEIRSCIDDNRSKFDDDEIMFKAFFIALSDRYSSIYSYDDDKSESENVTFRITKDFYNLIKVFNLNTVNYHNVQSFMRVATSWYYNTCHKRALGLGVYDSWKMFFVKRKKDNNSDDADTDDNIVTIERK